MFRIKKVLNHNSVIAIGEGDNREYLVMGKGIAFGKKITERIETGAEDAVYSLHELNTDRGVATDIIKAVSPECLELANEVLNRAFCSLWQIILSAQCVESVTMNKSAIR